MTEGGNGRPDLDVECQAFAAYLTGRAPNAYVLASYRTAHARGELSRVPAPSGFERLLLGLARRRAAIRMVDVYTALFARRSLVRKKLVLTLAILESCAPSYEHFEVPDGGSVAAVLASVAGRSLVSGLALVVAALVLAPAHAAYAASTRFSRAK